MTKYKDKNHSKMIPKCTIYTPHMSDIPIQNMQLCIDSLGNINIIHKCTINCKRLPGKFLLF